MWTLIEAHCTQTSSKIILTQQQGEALWVWSSSYHLSLVTFVVWAGEGTLCRLFHRLATEHVWPSLRQSRTPPTNEKYNWACAVEKCGKYELWPVHNVFFLKKKLPSNVYKLHLILKYNWISDGLYYWIPLCTPPPLKLWNSSLLP